MKLRLFALRNTVTRQLHTEFYSGKNQAKAARNALNNNKDDGPWVVSPGPDHRRSKA